MSAEKSTNVRTSLSAPKHRLLRRTFGVLERTAPQVGAAWAEKLWFTLPKVPASARRARVGLPPGEAFTASLDGRAIRGTVWGSGPVVYLVHGWGGWGLQLAAYVSPLVDAGFRVVAYDALSHGASDPGKDGPGVTALPEISDSLRAVLRQHGPAYAAIGHSFGAAVIANAMRDGFAADRLVFIAAANDFEPTVRLFENMLGFGPRIRKRLLRRFVRRVGVPIEHFNVSGIGSDLLAERGSLPPLLAIHDTDDPETPYEGSVQITEGWPAARLRPTDGLGHRQVLWNPTLVAEVVSFLAEGRSNREPDRMDEPDRIEGWIAS
jgi:pimeloyl-ACP methyl ester carboxylesterase